MAQFNKMFVMIPVMLMARKIDGEDPKIVQYIRIAYAVVQTICLLIVAYVYVQASSQAVKDKTQVVYVPPPPTPFADPNAKKKYSEIPYGTHVLNTARSLLGSTLFGVLLTVGLHMYKGMVMGLAIQIIMAPLNLLENPLCKAVLLGNGLEPADKIFEEKTLAELTPDDEIVDENGNVIVRGAIQQNNNKNGDAPTTMSFEEIMLDVWDVGAKADVGKLMNMLDKTNCNYQTKEEQWTPLMILAGLNTPKGTSSAIRQLVELGADVAMVDKEGWNALHWAAFHGNADAAKELAKQSSLLKVKDKEGLTPIDTARKENNEAVAVIYEAALGESKKSK